MKCATDLKLGRNSLYTSLTLISCQISELKMIERALLDSLDIIRTNLGRVKYLNTATVRFKF